MKKLISMLAVAGIVGTSSVSTISCSSNAKTQPTVSKIDLKEVAGTQLNINVNDGLDLFGSLNATIAQFSNGKYTATSLLTARGFNEGITTATDEGTVKDTVATGSVVYGYEITIKDNPVFADAQLDGTITSVMPKNPPIFDIGKVDVNGDEFYNPITNVNPTDNNFAQGDLNIGNLGDPNFGVSPTLKVNLVGGDFTIPMYYDLVHSVDAFVANQSNGYYSADDIANTKTISVLIFRNPGVQNNYLYQVVSEGNHYFANGTVNGIITQYKK